MTEIDEERNQFFSIEVELAYSSSFSNIDLEEEVHQLVAELREVRLVQSHVFE